MAASPQPASYAVVIGIEHYRDVPAPDGARVDSVRFAEMLRRTLGIPESNIHLANDERATKTDIEGHLQWLKTTATAGSRIYFFFSGHGAPDVGNGSSFLLPYDADAKRVPNTALSMTSVLKTLGESKARDVLAVVDACFSGAGGRSVLPPGARPLMRVRTPPPNPNLALFTASAGDEISGPVPGAHEGLFSRTLVDALANGSADMDGDGQISLAELSSWVSPRVSREARRDHREQNPQLVLGSGLAGPSQFIVAYGYAPGR